jgi:hypothetical protein
MPADQLAGFWPGLWHGLISPIAFIVSLFNPNVGIYEIHNNGAWYNLGIHRSSLLAACGFGSAGMGTV